MSDCEAPRSVKSLRPIRSERDYEHALAEVEELWGAKAGTPKGDRLDILATLIEAYETEHYPMDPPDPIEAIKFRMERQGLARKDLEGILGARTRVGGTQSQARPVDQHDPRVARQAWNFRGGPHSANSRPEDRLSFPALSAKLRAGAQSAGAALWTANCGS
jgi:HTH-type transcriptional regulator/antitoxin HigA